MAKPHVSPLVSGRIRLRLLEEADLPMTRAWRNQDHIRKWFLRSDVITPGQHQSWYAQYRDRDDDFVFVIEETETLKRPVGQVALYHVDRERGRAEFGRLMIGEEEARGQGLAKLATQVLLGHALGPCGLKEVYLDVLPANEAARALYVACGFEVVDRGDLTVTMRIDADARPHWSASGGAC